MPIRFWILVSRQGLSGLYGAIHGDLQFYNHGALDLHLPCERRVANRLLQTSDVNDRLFLPLRKTRGEEHQRYDHQAEFHRAPLSTGPPTSWMRHVLWFDERVKFFGADEAEFDGGFAEADVGVVGGFGDLGRGIVADFGSQGGDEHQGIVDIVFDLSLIDFDTLDAVRHETVHGVGEEFDGVQIVEDDDGLENV